MTAPTFFFDNNLSPALALGMKAFGERAIHLQDRFGENVEDVTWIPEVGREGLVVVTRDLAIRRRLPEISAYKEHALGGFWLGGKNRTSCEMIQQLVRSWPRMKDLAKWTERPFIWVVPPNGTTFERKL